MVECKYCGHQFLVVKQVTTGSATATPPDRSLSLQYEEELETLRRELQQSNSERARLSTKLERSKQQRNSFRHRTETLETELRQALEQQQVIQDELETSQHKLTELDRIQTEVITLRERASYVSWLEDSIQASQELTSRLDASLADRESHARSLEVELSHHQAEASRVEESRRELVAQMGALEHQLHILLGENQKRQLELEESLHQNVQLAQKFEAIVTSQAEAGLIEVTRLETQIAELQSVLEDQAHANEAKLVALTAEIAKVAGERDRLSEELKNVSAGFKIARAEIDELGQGLAEVARETARLEAEREAVARQRGEVQSRIKVREYELNEQLAELASTRERIEFEQASLQTRWDRERKAGLAQMERLARQLASIRSERDNLLLALRTAQRELAQLRNDRVMAAEAQGGAVPAGSEGV